MNITRFDPFNEFEKRINTLFSNHTGANNISSFVPKVNTLEKAEEYLIEVEVPGIKKEELDIDINGQLLTISGERKHKEEVKEDDYYKVESSFGKFQRSFTLPENVDKDNITAKTKDGVLEISIPKMEIETTKKIAVA